MKKSENGFSLLEVLVVILIIGLIGTVGWLVYDRQKPKTSNNTTPTMTTTTNKQATPTALKGNLSYASNVLSGWTEEHQQGSSIYNLTNDQLGCNVSAGVDKPKTDLSGVQPPAGAASREVTLGTGQKVTVYEMGQEKEYYTNEGHLVKDDFNVNVTVACKDKANFSSADPALKSINLE